MRWSSWVLVLTVLSTVLAALAPNATSAASQAPARRVLGYYVPYDAASFASLEAHAHLIDDVAVQWVTIDGCGQIGSKDNRTLIQFAHERGIRVFPSLLTLSNELNHRLLTDEATTATAVSQIVEYVIAEGYDGFDLDLEGIKIEDRDAYSAFVARVAAALHERGKLLHLAIPPKVRETMSGWAGAYDYAALGQHADLITIMAYEFSGPFSGPGSVAPHDWVDQVADFATDQIPPEKVLLGLAFYGWDWNTTTAGRTRSLTYPQAAALSQRYQSPIVLDPRSQSGRFRYQAPAGEAPPPIPQYPALNHEIAVREPPPCANPIPAPTPVPPRPPLPPDAIQSHEVWIEVADGVEARLGLASRHATGGVATWRLGQEDPRVWEAFEKYRIGGG